MKSEDPSHSRMCNELSGKKQPTCRCHLKDATERVQTFGRIEASGDRRITVAWDVRGVPLQKHWLKKPKRWMKPDDALRWALNSWQKCIMVRFVRVAAPPADITITVHEVTPHAWGATSRLGYPAHIWINPYARGIPEGAYHRKTLQGLFCHEIGHALGFAHTDREDSVVWHYIKNSVRRPTVYDIGRARRMGYPPRKGWAKLPWIKQELKANG